VIKVNANSVICLAAPLQKFGETDFCKKNSAGRELPTAHSTPAPERKGSARPRASGKTFGTPHSHHGWRRRFSDGKNDAGKLDRAPLQAAQKMIDRAMFRKRPKPRGNA
jgi:hypothetical protein